MAKKQIDMDITEQAAMDARDQALVPMKVRRDSLRLIKMLAAWKDMTMADYFHEMVSEAARQAASDIASDLDKAK